MNKGKNNGVLLLLDIGGRKSRIKVGYYLESEISDTKSGRIQDSLNDPQFQGKQIDKRYPRWF